MKCLLIIAAIFSFYCSAAQVTDNFNDGNYTSNPTWTTPVPADWIVNPAFQLQSNNTTPNSNFYISTANTLSQSAQWDFYSQLAFNPSGANFIDFFLTASGSDLLATATNGYFVRLGNTDDEVSLWRKDGATTTKIIDGVNGTLNSSNNILRIRVIRTAANQWSLLRDIGATGSYISEGIVTDATYTTSAFTGIVVRQSTVSFIQRHYFDDIEIKPFVPDVTPPVIVSATAITNNTVDILFNEPVDLTTSQQVTNYAVNNGVGIPSSAVRDLSNPALVHLTFAPPFPGNTLHQITVNNVSDVAGNLIVNGTATFSFFVASQYSVIIDEIMADPTPLVGLPDAEWVELKNTSGFDINLQGWRIGKPSGQSGPMPSFILRADSFVIVTTSGSVAALSVYGNVISVTSFPSLSNTGDLLYIRSADGRVIHSVNYTDDWYKNELKQQGGWSLEMIDTDNPCSGISNWTASISPQGGTPGKKNSVDAINADQISPRLLRAYAPDSITIVLVFDEPLDSIVAATASNYSVSNGPGTPVSATPVSPSFDRVRLILPAPMIAGTTYTVTVSSIKDCAGNVVNSGNNTARVGLDSNTDSLNIVINEILFNPPSDGADYVELYNRSNKILNLKDIYIANRATNGSVGSINQISAEDYLFFPGDFIVVTDDVAAVKRHYVSNNPLAFIEIASMPSYSDDEGNVIILNEQGRIIDEVNYKDDWHFKLISNDEGVALERIDYDGGSNDPDNWHSASSHVNYGTPGYKNSQFRINTGVQGEIKLTPEIFSPDNDGVDDFATLDYSFPEPGYVSNVTIFDASGRPVRYLKRNTLNGITGFYRWDGLNEKGLKLPVGIYIIYTEIYNLQGKTKRFKNVIVLARKNN